jgi:hypothetical protein
MLKELLGEAGLDGEMQEAMNELDLARDIPTPPEPAKRRAVATSLKLEREKLQTLARKDIDSSRR